MRMIGPPRLPLGVNLTGLLKIRPRIEFRPAQADLEPLGLARGYCSRTGLGAARGERTFKTLISAICLFLPGGSLEGWSDPVTRLAEPETPPKRTLQLGVSRHFDNVPFGTSDIAATINPWQYGAHVRNSCRAVSEGYRDRISAFLELRHTQHAGAFAGG